MRTPTRRPELSRASPSPSRRARGTMISPVAGTGSSSGTNTNASSTQRALSPSSLMSFGIDGLLERLQAGAAHGVQETLVALADGEIGVDHGLDGVGDLAGAHGRAQDLGQG